MRVELVAIHTTLYTFATHEMVGIFTDSLSSLQAIKYHYTNPGTTRGPQHHHHHELLLRGTTDLLEERKGFTTTLQKIRAPTSIRGNDLADAAAKLAVTHYDSLPETQTLKVNTG